MKTRLIRKESVLLLLLDNGKLLYVEKKKLAYYLFHHKTLLKNNHNHLIFEVAGKWDDEYDEMTEYPGDTIAYTNNKGHLVIVEISPFEECLNNKKDTSDEKLFVTVKEYADEYGKSKEQVKVFCREGRIAGAKKIGRDWMIPKDAPYPTDRRIKTGATIKSGEIYDG